MAEVNPYQKPTGDEGDPRHEEKPFDPDAAGVLRGPLWVTLGLVVLLGAVLGVVVGSAAFAVIDRIHPVSWFVFSGSTVGALIVVFLIAGAAATWIAWTLLKKGYPWRRLSAIGAAGWALGLLVVWGIVRADTAMEERNASAACGRSSAGPGVSGVGTGRCEADYLRCRRWLKQQPGYGKLTYDAENAMMSECMLGGPRTGM